MLILFINTLNAFIFIIVLRGYFGQIHVSPKDDTPPHILCINENSILFSSNYCEFSQTKAVFPFIYANHSLLFSQSINYSTQCCGGCHCSGVIAPLVAIKTGAVRPHNALTPRYHSAQVEVDTRAQTCARVCVCVRVCALVFVRALCLRVCAGVTVEGQALSP